MTRWLLSKGAKNLVLVSRSGTIQGKLREMIDEFSPLGANIVVKKCDVAIPTAVNSLINEELKDMPPVKGVIHGAMVLRV